MIGSLTDNRGWRAMRRFLITLAALATLIAVFYTEEDWRGKRDWQQCRSELEAKGEVLDWNAYIPPPVPDDQNVFKAPKMQEWFVRHNTDTTNELNGLVTNAQKTAIITSPAVAANFLAWSDHYQPDFDLMREALKRPYTRMDGDYTVPSDFPIDNFITVRALVQVLAQRTKCYLLLGQPDQALEQLTLLNDSRRMMERLPTGQPETLVDAMINVAVTSLYAETIAYGLKRHAWEEPQLMALQQQLEAIDLPPFVGDAFKAEQASLCHALETIPMSKIMDIDDVISSPSKITLWQKLLDLDEYGYDFMPRGWIYQNMIVLTEIHQRQQDGFDLTNEIISPQAVETAQRGIVQVSNRHSPFYLFAKIAVPNLTKAYQRLAFVQTEVNEAQLACALERYHQIYGVYPGSLDLLVPHFIEALPHDIIGGGSLIYRPANDGKFLLYSVGWNETDDGGKIVLDPLGNADLGKGDWVWKN